MAPQQQRRRHHQRHAHGHQRHPGGVALEPGDGLHAAADVLPAVGHGGGPRRAGIALVGHAQEDAAIVPPVLALQPLQDPLVAEGLQVVPRQIGAMPQEGAAPVEAPEKADEEPPGGVVVFEVQQLVEQDLLVRCLPGGQGQHRSDHAADERGGQALHLHGGAHGQSVLSRRGPDGRAVRRGPPPEGPPQADVGDEIPAQEEEHAGRVDQVQPVRRRPGRRRRGQGDGDRHPGQGPVLPGEGGADRLHQPGPVEQDIPPAQPRRDQQRQPQHAPDGGLPPGGQLVAEHGLHHQQQRRRAGGGEGLQKEAPEVPHGYTSISSRRRRRSSRSPGERACSFKNAATRSLAEPR